MNSPLREFVAMARPKDGWLYRDAQYLALDVEIDRDAARRWLPSPLVPARRPLATFFLAHFPWTTFGSVYSEAGILLHALHGRREVVHSPWMLVDDDVALIVGRELLGYPKKLGEIDLAIGGGVAAGPHREGDAIDGVARRRGETLIEVRGTLGAALSDSPPILARPHRNVRAAIGIALPWLLAFTPRERVIEVRAADLELRVRGSARDPLHELGASAPLAARLHRVDLASGSMPHPVGLVSPRAHLSSLLRRVR